MPAGTPEAILALFQRDRFARLLGIQIERAGDGSARCRLRVDEGMLNGKDIVQGGAIFTLCDFAMAVASNTHGRIAYTIDAAITYLKAVGRGETLTTRTTELSCGNKIASYRVEVLDAGGGLIAEFHGTCYRTGEEIPGETGT